MIAQKYYILHKINQGSFGLVYKGQFKNKEYVAIKIENSNINMLKHETSILNYLSNKGCLHTPYVYWYGLHEDKPTLIMPFYDISLETYLLQLKITKEEKIYLIIKMIKVLQIIHNLGIIHRDLKPQNFMIKKDDIFLIDFGLSTIYVDEEMKCLPEKNTSEYIIGTPKFISLHIHNGKDASRRDDLISLMYIYLYMTNNLFLPWDNIEIKEDSYTANHILHCKNQDRKTIKEKYHELLEKDMIECKIFSYLYNVTFSEKPHYQWMISVLEEEL